MEAVKEAVPVDIRVFYLMNGQILFAEFFGTDEETDDFVIRHAVMVMIGQNKQIGMSTAYPFTNIDDDVILSWRQVTASSDLNWNRQLVGEYEKFWTQLQAKAAGIILPGQPGSQMPPTQPPGRPGPGPMRPTIVK